MRLQPTLLLVHVPLFAPVTALPFGATFGNGLAGVPICGSSKPPSLIVNHTLAAGETHGVLHHFWTTGAQFAIDRMWVEYFIDGEVNASISFQPSMMCGFAFPTHIKPNHEYSAGGLCGKSAPVGGWFNTFPIPFYKSAVVTVRADPIDGSGCFGGYVNVRGTVGLPLVLPISGVPLPMPGTRLTLQRNPMAVRQPLEYVKLAELPAGQPGMVFQVAWAVETKPVGGPQAGGGYIEGCWQFYRQANESFPGLVVGTGVEDYFDSGYYFGADSGDPVGIPFSNAMSGLTFFERTKDGYERVSAYRFHTNDPLVMTDGGSLVWRVGAQGKPGTTKCGNPLPQPGQPTGANPLTTDELEEEHESYDDSGLGRTLSAINLMTYAWVYTFATTTTTTTTTLTMEASPAPSASVV